ncbi:MAG TPA: GxxExxY protein [Chthoniobacterales bacterium]
MENKIIVDAKTVAAFTENHSAQMLGYLAMTGLELGILLNFKYAKLEWTRLAKSRLLSE